MTERATAAMSDAGGICLDPKVGVAEKRAGDIAADIDMASNDECRRREDAALLTDLAHS